VRVPLHHQLLTWRSHLAEAGHHPRRRRLAFRLAAGVLRNPVLYERVTRIGRWLARRLSQDLLDRLGGPWSRSRAMPRIPERSFHQALRARELEKGR